VLVFAVPSLDLSALVWRRACAAVATCRGTLCAGPYALFHAGHRSVSVVAIAVGGWRWRPALNVAGVALAGLGRSHDPPSASGFSRSHLRSSLTSTALAQIASILPRVSRS